MIYDDKIGKWIFPERVRFGQEELFAERWECRVGQLQHHWGVRVGWQRCGATGAEFCYYKLDDGRLMSRESLREFNWLGVVEGRGGLLDNGKKIRIVPCFKYGF